MSFWWYSKGKDGKKSITSISIPYHILILMFGMISALIAPPLWSGNISPQFLLNFLCVISGFFLFLISKLFQFKKGKWISWGLRNMSVTGKICYIAGYILMLIGAIKLLLLYTRL